MNLSSLFRRLNLKGLNVWIGALTLLGLFFFSEESAYAWGVGVHMMHGDFVLRNLSAISGSLAEIIRAFPKDFLYGCVSADIFIGKGSKFHADHCHNWSVAHKLFEQAKEPELQAFACGYFSHLAADVIAHNIYVPNQLYLTSSTSRWGHIYWELRADEYTNQKFWEQVLETISGGNEHTDAFVQGIVKKNLISFEMKKKLFTQAVKIYDLGKRREAVSLVSRNSRWDVTEGYIQDLNQKCLNLIVDFLMNPKSALCYQFDPIGSQRLAEAKKLRRFSKRIHGKEPTEYVFDTPVEIESLPCCPVHGGGLSSELHNNGSIGGALPV